MTTKCIFNHFLPRQIPNVCLRMTDIGVHSNGDSIFNHIIIVLSNWVFTLNLLKTNRISACFDKLCFKLLRIIFS